VKRSSFLALTVMLSLVLAACAAPTPAPTPVAAPPTVGSSTHPTAVPPTSKPAQPVTIVVAIEMGSQTNERQALFEGLFKEYMGKNPNVTIKFEPVVSDYDQYITKLLVDLKSGTGPDIFTTTGSTLLKFAETGELLTAPAEVEAYVKKEALNEAVLSSVTGRDGKMYGIPWMGDWPALFYNKDMYQKSGITKVPTTWEELLDASKKLTRVDAQGNITTAGFFVRKSGAQLGIFEKWYPFFSAAGGEIFDKGMTKCTVNSPEGVEALQFYVDLIHVAKVDSFEAAQGDTKGFISGNVAQYIRESSNITRFQNEAPSLKFGTALIPSHKTTGKGIANIDSIVVTKACKNPQAAWDFLMWLSSPEIATRRDKALYRQPLFKTVSQDPFYKDNELIQPFLQQEAHIFPLHPNAYDMETAIGKYVEMALHKQMSPKEALDEAAKEVDALLKKE